MNDKDLDALLKSNHVPERAGEYWEQFPGRVMGKLHWRAQRAANGLVGERDPNAAARHKPRFHFLRLPAFGVGVALACVLLGFALGFWKGQHSTAPERSQIAEALKCFREVKGLFPNQVESIVFDDKGARLVLADGPSVPDSSPVYVKVCGPSGCQRFVTFSGQQIRVNGDVFEVLLDRHGEVLLVGGRDVWSSSEPLRSIDGYRIDARPLPAES
jgi:hypothetical protein